MSASARTEWVDALRGVAVVWMIAYHFCFDLNWYGWANWQMLSDPFWTTQRAGIVSLFMFTAGLSQVLAWRAGQSAAAFWRRWRQIAGAAILVSVGSYLAFPNTWIYFGVLHAMALMWLLTRVLGSRLRSPWVWALVGTMVWASAWAVPAALQAWQATAWQAALNGAGLNALGWVSKLPVTEDYAPLAPWWGVMMWGVAAGLWWFERGRCAGFGVAGVSSRLGRGVQRLGRHSLLVYLLHQPLMLAGFELVRWL